MSGIIGEIGSKSSVIGDYSGDTLGFLVGMIAPFAMTSVPTGWLVCDGSAVSRTVTYSALYEAIGTTWGTGDGSTTFNVPDLEGAFLRGTGSHATSNMSNGNDYAGASVGAFENDQTLSHRHSTNHWGAGSTPTNPTNNQAKPIRYQGGTGVGNTNWGDPYTARYTNSSLYGDTWTAATTTVSNGYNYLAGYEGDETRPFNAGVKYCIKY